MARHLIYIFLVSALIILCMFRPFMPGRYDALAVTMSFMAQIFSFAAVILIPPGMMWLFGKFNKFNPETLNRRMMTITLLALCLIPVPVSLAPLSSNNMAFGVIFLACCYSIIFQLYRRNKNRATFATLNSLHIALYLILIPVIVLTARYAFMDKAVQYSRELAIRNSEDLIRKIEMYFNKNGHYPSSLQSLVSDFKPNVVGISNYFYEPHGNAYHLYFRQFSDELDAHEIVMYNKFDAHAFAAHDSDILEYTGEELALRRGDRRKYKLPAPHWVLIKYD